MVSPSLAASPTDVLLPSTPEALGFSADLADKLDAGVRSGLLNGLHSVLVARNGRLILERYYAGTDESWGKHLGRVTFTPDTLHDLRSVTKSIVALLYGIALERGLVPPPEAPLLAEFPQYPDLAADPKRALLQINHALSMTLGLEWDEMRPYSDPANSEIAMENAPDRFRFILERSIVSKPGQRWTYSGGAVALIGAIIQKGTKMGLLAFAREALFAPLGITEAEWVQGRDGMASAASGLRLKPRDLLRIGQLVLARGRWQDQQLIPEAWVDSLSQSLVSTGDGLHYARLWWHGMALAPALKGERPWLAGLGNGGQRLWILPDAGLVTVIHCGNYNKPDQWVTPLRIWREIVLANLQRL